MAKKDEDEDELPAVLTVEQVAQLMGIKAASVGWYLSQKPDMVPPRVSWTRKRLFDRAVVLEWLRKRTNAIELKNRFVAVSDANENFERPPRVVKKGRPRRQA